MQPAPKPTLDPSVSTIHKHQETRTMTRHILALALALAISGILAASAQAASLTWDIDPGTSGAQIGNGTWTDGAGNWWNSSTSANANWNNATPDAATFTDTAAVRSYKVTLGSNIVAASITRGGGYTELITIAPDVDGLYKLTLNGNFTVTRGMQIDAPLVLAGDGVTHTIAGSYPLIINGDISETGGVNAIQPSFGPTLRLTGNNSFSGGVLGNTASQSARIELGTNTAAGSGPLRLGRNNIWVAINGNRILANPWVPALAGTRAQQDWYTQFEGDEFHFTTTGILRLEGLASVSNSRWRFIVDNAKTTFDGGIDNGTTAGYVMGIVKEGAGILAINGDSAFDGDGDYTEAITVKAGTLILNGNIFSRDGSSGQKSTLVEAGATLGGTGTLNIRDGFALTAISGGTLAPGESVGTFTVDGDVNLAGTLEIEIDAGGADLLVVGGELNLDGAVLSVSFIDGFAPTDAASWMVLDWGSLSGSGFSQINLPALSGPLSWDTSQLLTDGLLLLNIPEPSSLALLGLAGLAVWRRR